MSFCECMIRHPADLYLAGRSFVGKKYERIYEFNKKLSDRFKMDEG